MAGARQAYSNDQLYHLSRTSCNIMAGILHVTYDRVHIPAATSRDQTITGF